MKEHIRNGNLERAINHALKASKKSNQPDLYQSILQQSSIYKRLKTQRLRGLISEESYEVNSNRISMNLIELADVIEDKKKQDQFFYGHY